MSKKATKKQVYHYGIFYKKGWKPICLFETKEQAQKFIDERTEKVVEIREIEWYD